jgi:hypothetical protein
MFKRGQSESDLVVFIAVIFIVLIIGVVVVKSFGGINTGLQAHSADIGVNAVTASTNAFVGFSAGFNAAAVIAIGIMYIGLFITSRYIGTEPMWFFINVFLLVLALGVAMLLANAWDAATNNPSFVTERASMPALVFIGNNLLLFGIGAAAVILVGLFAKPFGGDGSGI